MICPTCGGEYQQNTVGCTHICPGRAPYALTVFPPTHSLDALLDRALAAEARAEKAEREIAKWQHTAAAISMCADGTSEDQTHERLPVLVAERIDRAERERDTAREALRLCATSLEALRDWCNSPALIRCCAIADVHGMGISAAEGEQCKTTWELHSVALSAARRCLGEEP